MGKCKYNWNDIQKDYDNGLSWRDLRNKYGVNFHSLSKAILSNRFKTRTKSESAILDHRKNPNSYLHSEETKKKISIGRTKYLKEHPDQVPYLLNHYSKGDSYPERYFKELFEIENINLKHHTQIGLYQLDFYNKELKIDVEIDGDQHHLDKRIAESDIRRTAFLESQGWTVFRVKWSDYQKLKMDDRKLLIDKIRKLVTIQT